MQEKLENFYSFAFSRNIFEDFFPWKKMKKIRCVKIAMLYQKFIDYIVYFCIVYVFNVELQKRKVEIMHVRTK